MIRFAVSVAVIAAAMSTAATAADLIVEEDIAEVAMAAYDWSGPYVGLQVGVMQVDVDPTDPDLLPSGLGFLIGGHLGLNHQMDSFVIGAEADVEYSSFSTSADCDNSDWECATWLDWQGSLRARAGIASDNALFYLTAGLAVANFGASTDLDDDGIDVFEDSGMRWGWTAGAGIEFGLSEEMTARVEYRYTDYGSEDMNLDILYPDVGVTTHAVRLGLSWAM